jgi:hypothetical protein
MYEVYQHRLGQIFWIVYRAMHNGVFENYVKIESVLFIDGDKVRLNQSALCDFDKRYWKRVA